MKRDTRQEILLAAKKLFNQRGYNAVSTRDIAEALGISKGNLTYHFKKKEEIMEAILTELPGGTPPEAPGSLADLDGFFLDLEQAIRENAFYFWHHTQLSQLSDKIHNMQKTVFLRNTEKLLQAFHTLQADGLLQPENFPGQYNHIIDTLLLSAIYWGPFSQLKQDASQSFRQHAWTTLRPLLTIKGTETVSGQFLPK